MNTAPLPTAVVADDERLMRDQIIGRLKDAWPELQVVGEAANGSEAVALVQSLEPDIVFLDISMCSAPWNSPAPFVPVSTST